MQYFNNNKIWSLVLLMSMIMFFLSVISLDLHKDGGRHLCTIVDVVVNESDVYVNVLSHEREKFNRAMVVDGNCEGDRVCIDRIATKFGNLTNYCRPCFRKSGRKGKDSDKALFENPNQKYNQKVTKGVYVWWGFWGFFMLLSSGMIAKEVWYDWMIVYPMSNGT